MLKKLLTFVLMSFWIASEAGAIGLDFVPNVGQSRDGSAFSTEIPGAHVAFRSTAVEYTFAVSHGLAQARMEMIGANPRPAIAGAGLLPGIVNVYTDTATFSKIPTYGGLRYESVYPGIDLELDGGSGSLKSTWVVAPRADPARIRWRYEGFDHVGIDAEGNLVLTLPAEAGEEARVVTETAPVAWQNVEGRRVPVEVRYQERKDGSLAFGVGAYDEGAPLVIDPTLIYNRKVPGLSSGDGVAADAAGNVYLVGTTFLVTNYEGYVTKLNAGGERQWTTTFSDFNSGNMSISDVALGPDNQVYAAGQGSRFGYVAKLNSENGNVEWGIWGGSNGSSSIALDAQGNSYVASGRTLTKRDSGGGFEYMTTMPTTSIRSLNAVTIDGAGNPVIAGVTPNWDVSVSVLNADGSIGWSKVFGGSSPDSPTGIAVDAAGNIVVVGSTKSSDFPRRHPVDGELTDSGECSEICADGFVTVLRTDQTHPIFSSFFGGNGDDVVQDVDVEAQGAILLAGWTETGADGGFPMNNAIHPLLGGRDAFAAKLGLRESVPYGIDYSTPLGDPDADYAWSSALVGPDIYVSGVTIGNEHTAFVAKLRSTLLPAGDVVNINFQPEESEVPEGYLPDSGLPYDDRGNGWSYGWVPFGESDVPMLVANELGQEIDQQYDTYVGLAEAEKTVLRWEIGVPPGRYTVRLVVGDPHGAQGPPWPTDWTQAYAEGVPFISEWRADSPDDTWLERTATVRVDDGRLTLTLDTRAEEWRLSLAFLEISAATVPNQAPSVSVTAPRSGEVFNNGRLVTIHAQAEDPDGQIDRVAFYVTDSSGRRLLGTDTTAPYSFNWGCLASVVIRCYPVSPGSYRIDAVAIDKEGATRQSAAVEISVNSMQTKRSSFEVELKVFLPGETAAIPGSLGDPGQVTRGDDRDFSTTSRQHRALQQVTLIPSRDFDEDGIKDGTIANFAGGTVNYDLGSSVNPETGRLTPQARSESLIESNRGFPYMMDYGDLGAHLDVVPVPRESASAAEVHFTGNVFDPLLVGDCQLIWDLGVRIDVTDRAAPVARVQGAHGGFPAFEIYIDGEPVYRWMPPAGRTAEYLCEPGAGEEVDSGLIRLK